MTGMVQAKALLEKSIFKLSIDRISLLQEETYSLRHQRNEANHKRSERHSYFKSSKHLVRFTVSRII